MGEIIFFNNRNEDDPDNLLAKPHEELRDWDDADEFMLPANQAAFDRYPEAFIPTNPETEGIIDSQRRAIYPEAYKPEAPSLHTEGKSIRRRDPVFHDIPRRIVEAIRKMSHPRKMNAPSVSHIAGAKMKRVRMPGPTRTAVRDAIRSLLKHL